MSNEPGITVYASMSPRTVVVAIQAGGRSASITMSPDRACDLAEQLQAAADMINNHVKPKREPAP